MKKYKQLILAQRYQIQTLLAVGFTQTAISKQIGVHRSTISRELKRNLPRWLGYVSADLQSEPRIVLKNQP